MRAREAIPVLAIKPSYPCGLAPGSVEIGGGPMPPPNLSGGRGPDHMGKFAHSAAKLRPGVNRAA